MGQGKGQSLGDTKTQGSRGNNFNWQFNVIQLLKNIRNGDTIPGASNDFAIERLSAEKIYEAETLISISIYNAGGSTVTVNGVDLLTTERVSFSANPGCTLRSAFVVDATGSDVLVTTLVP